MLLDFNEKYLEENNSIHTISEICQQPEVWMKVLTLVKAEKQNIINKINGLIKNNPDIEIIFTGAGTSEFVGNSIYNYFIKKDLNVKSVATTDITANPLAYINPSKEILLVSFARSGNSPESVATYDLVNELGERVTNLVITCNKDGELAKRAKSNDKNYLFLLPDEANDKSFAMTSSFTGMIVACLLILDINNLDQLEKEINVLAKNVTAKIDELFKQIKDIAYLDHKRIVFLGSDNFKGFSQESHLKVLELTAGEITAFYNSPLGFRHGPKSVLNKESIVFIMMNQDKNSRIYTLDLLNELDSQKQIDKLVVLDYFKDNELANKLDNYFSFDFESTNEILIGLNYMVFTQIYAFYKSLSLGKQPDNPWPSGLVNRVVQGVIIHKYKK